MRPAPVEAHARQTAPVTTYSGQDLLLTALRYGLLLLAVVALADCVRHPAAAFVAAGKQTKPVWLAITGGSVLLVLVFRVGVLNLLGAAVAVGCTVYLVDVRPAVSGMRPGSGPYG